jgi:ribulose-bisphosphate carboxylase large chain
MDAASHIVRIIATYHVTSDAAGIAARAQAIAIEQSIECPLEAVGDPQVLTDIVGTVEGIAAVAPGRYAVRIGLAAATAPPEPGQLLNMLFGNSSIQEDIVLADAELPPHYAEAFGGPRVGFDGIRALTGVTGRALTASALKPQGISAQALGEIAYKLALGGLDLIKDDHGLADQAYSPFAARAAAVAKAVQRANRETGRRTIYTPNISGTLDTMRQQLAVIRNEGIDGVMMAPMIAGVANFHAIVKEATGLVVLTHPALAGAVKFAPPLLLGKLFRLFGGDVSVYPNYGGRFAYSQETCRALTRAALDRSTGLKPCVPMPAGGMTVARVPEMLEFYGQDVALLIGGSLLSARDRLVEETSLFVKKVAEHGQG